MRFLFGALLVCTSALCVVHAAKADPPPAPAAQRGELALDIEPGAAGLDATKIRAAIERELDAPTSAATPSSRAVISIRSRGEHRVLMTFRQANGRSVAREVDLPQEPERATEMLGLLAVNLVRDEAAELIAAMMKRAAPTSADAEPIAQAVAERPATDVRPCRRRDGYHFVTLGVDFAPFVGTSSLEPDHTVRRWSLQFAGGYSEGVHGIALSPLLSMTGTFVCGAQVAGIANIVGGPVEGAQIGALVDIANGDVQGAQFAGGLSFARRVRGAQIAGGMSLAPGGVDGVQLSPVAIAGGNRGAQLGLIALSTREVSGLQMGVANFAARGAPGPEDADERADESIRGTQFGVVNVATGTVRGIQIGVVNYADDTDFSLGIVNIIRKGRVGIDVFGSEIGSITGALKHGGKYWHYIYGAAYNARLDRGGFVLGLGAHLPLRRSFYLDVDSLAEDDGAFGPMRFLAQLRTIIGRRLVGPLAVYGGLTYNAYFTNDAATEAPMKGRFVTSGTSGSVTYWRWPGMVAGLQLSTGD